MINSIISTAFDRTRTIILLFLFLVIYGWVGYEKIPKESDPDVQIPFIYVSVTHQGISAEDSERLLVKPIENELINVEGLKEITGTSQEVFASIMLEFNAGFDIDTALRDVRDKVDQVKSELPDDADEPIVKEINVALFPVIAVVLSGPVPQRELVQYARDLKDSLKGAEGVLEVNVDGDREDVMEIIVDPQTLETYNLNLESFFNAINRNNQLIAAGSMESDKGRISIKIPGVIESIKDVLTLPIKFQGQQSVLFRDIAKIRRTFKDPVDFVNFNNDSAVTLNISKRIGTNIIETINNVREAVELERESWPDSIKITYRHDESRDILDMLNDLENNILSAILLVMIVIIATLGVRSGLLVGLAIPGSFLTTILILYIFNYTTNIVILFSLILVVGMLVDGAIVITELANRNMVVEKMSAKKAYHTASVRMALPIISSTLTTMLVFTPLLFWPGIIGQFMVFLPTTVLIALTASLVMTLVILPVIGGMLGKPRDLKKQEKQIFDSEDTERLLKKTGFVGEYVKLLTLVLKYPFIAFITIISVAIIIYINYFMFGKGVEFFPNIDIDYAKVQIRARGNLSLTEKRELVQQVEKAIVPIPDIKDYYTKTLDQVRGQDSNRMSEDTIGFVEVQFEDWHTRRKPNIIINDIRKATENIPGVIVEVLEDKPGPGQGKPIQIEIRGPTPKITDDITAFIRDQISEIPGIVDVEDTLAIPGIELEIKIDREKAAEYEIDVTTLGNTVLLITKGITIAEYRPDDTNEEVDIITRFPESERNFEKLLDLKIQTIHGLVPMQNFAKLIPKDKTTSIQRVNTKRTETIKANVASEYLVDDKIKEIMMLLSTLELNPKISVTFKGESKDQAEASTFLKTAFFIAVFLMLLLLVTQFNSFYQAFLILSAIVTSTAGVLLGLLITNQPFGIVMSGIGVIALAGIVVNNNIILIDTYNEMKAKGYDTKTSLLITGSLRLRPVLLTSITTVLGLMPMVLSLNIDFFERTIDYGAPSTQWWNQLSTSIAGGLTFSTILTLLLTPAMIMLGHNIYTKLTKKPTHETAR